MSFNNIFPVAAVNPKNAAECSKLGIVDTQNFAESNDRGKNVFKKDVDEQDKVNFVQPYVVYEENKKAGERARRAGEATCLVAGAGDPPTPDKSVPYDKPCM